MSVAVDQPNCQEEHQRFAKETHFFPRPSTNGEAYHLVSSVFGHPRIKIVVSHSSFGPMAASSLQPRWTRGIEECFNYRRGRARAFSIKFEKKSILLPVTKKTTALVPASASSGVSKLCDSKIIKNIAFPTRLNFTETPSSPKKGVSGWIHGHRCINRCGPSSKSNRPMNWVRIHIFFSTEWRCCSNNREHKYLSMRWSEIVKF